MTSGTVGGAVTGAERVRSMIRSIAGDVVLVYRRNWWRLASAQLTVGAVLGVVLYGLVQLSAAAATLLRGSLTTSGSLDLGAAVGFGLVILVIFVLICVPVLLAGAASAMTIADRELSGKQPRVLASLRAGARRIPALMFVVGATAALVLVFVVAAPLVCVIAVLGLLLTPVVRLMRHKRPGLLPLWPSLRAFGRLAIPFALAFRWAARGLMAIPLAALTATPGRASLREAGRVVETRSGLVVLSVLCALVATTLIGAAGSLLGYVAGGDLGSQLGQVLTQLVFLPLTFVTMAVVYRVVRQIPRRMRVLRTSRIRLTRNRVRSTPTAALLQRVALVMPAVLVFSGLVVLQAPLASAAPSPVSVVLTVTSPADDLDAATLASQRQNCVSGSGDCTLRAALAEAEAQSVTGAAGAIRIDFASDTTIAVTAGSPLHFDNTSAGLPPGETPPGENPPRESPPGETPPGETPRGETPPGEGTGHSNGTLTIDGTGHAVTIDGQSTTQIMSLFSRSWNVVVRGLELRNGRATTPQAGQGGGLFVGGTRSALIEAVTFVGNTAFAGGGLYMGTTVEVRNSTFSENSLAGPSVDFMTGGADIFAGGKVSAINNTFVGSHGGAIYNWSSVGNSLVLTNSLIAVTASDAQGGFNCSGGGITGSSNLIIGDETTCPGILPGAAPSLGPLARTTPGTPPVYSLLPVRANPALGAGAAVCPPTDARGLARPSTGCDLGAYQFDPETSISLTSSQNPVPYGDRVAITALVTSPHEPAAVARGTVQFQVDGVDAGLPIALSADGTASLPLNQAASGAYSVTAAFTPDAFNAYQSAVTATPLAQIITAVGTQVTLQSEAARANLGDDVALTVRVGDEARVVTGTVSILDITDGTETPVLSDQPLTGALTTVHTRSLQAGTRLLVAAYSGDANNTAGRSAAVPLIILAPSTIALTADATSRVHGAPVAVTATVPASAGPTPTGFVVFTLGPDGETLGTVPLTGGSAELTLDRLSAGDNSVFAHYLGDDTYAQSSRASVAVTITPAETSTTLVSGWASPVEFGVPVTVTTVVRTDSPGSSADPTGTITYSSTGPFSHTSTVIGTATLIGNGDGTSTASYTATAGQLTVGYHDLSAAYSPSSDFTASDSASERISVVPATTATTLASDASPSPIGSAVLLTATVSGSRGSVAVPSGSVVFSTADGVALGSAVLINGVATLTTAGLGLGRHEIHADYAATSSFTDSTGVLTQLVGAATTTTSVTPERTESVFGRPLRADIAVTGQSGDRPDGVVVVTEGTVTYAVVTVAEGAASVDLTALGAGVHNLIATFREANGYLASSGTARITISAAPTTTALQLPSTSPYFGDPVTMTATVSNTDALTTSTPRGAVRFTMNGSFLGQVAVFGDESTGRATASLTTGSLPQSSAYPRGQLPILAEFIPDPASPDFGASTASETVAVLAGTTAIALDVTPGTVGAEVTATAIISVTRGSGTPTGTVRFYVNSTTTDVSVAAGRAVLTGLLLPRGNTHITAVYTSDSLNFQAGGPGVSDSAGANVEIGAGTASVSLSSSAPGTFSYGTPAELTATVASDGVAPTGTVSFVARGPNGDVVLGSTTLGSAAGAFTSLLAPGADTSSQTTMLRTGANATTAVLSTGAIPAGTQILTAVYSGDFSYGAGTSDPLSQTVTPAATATTIAASAEPSVVATEVLYSARVTTTTGAVPAGTVSFAVDGVPLAISTTDSSGVATVKATPLRSGTVRVGAIFTPSDPNTVSSTGALSHRVAAMPTTVVLSTDRSKVTVGDAATFSVSVTPPTAYPTLTDTMPTGPIVVSSSDGSVCEATLSMRGPAPGEMLGECTLTFAATGSRRISATYGGDNFFAGGSANSVSVSIVRLAPTITFATASERAWVGGETTTVAWQVSGPSADDAAVSIMRGSTTVCTSMQRTGTCDYTFPARAGGPDGFTLRYAGDDAWLSASATLNQTVSACVPTTAATTSPSGAGTVTADPQPNCAGGTGYLAGTSVRYRATPAEGYTFDQWARGTDTVVATVGGSVGNTAYFTVECVSVRLRVIDDGNPGARVATTPARPNCGPLPRDWTTDSLSDVGLFAPGTSLTLTAHARPPARPGPQTFYRWTGLPTGADSLAPTVTVTVPAGLSMTIGAVFGVECFHNIAFPPPRGGTAQLGAPNCTDAVGPGYAADSFVAVSTKATSSGFFSGWTNAEVRDVVSTATGSTGSLYISGDNLVVGAGYTSCVQVGLAVDGELPNGTRLGSATITPTGNCPGRGEGWYATGTTVRVEATPSNSMNKFGGWSGLTVDRPTATTAWATIGSAGTITATFYSSMRCVPITLVSDPAGALNLSASFIHGTGTCPAGQYDTSIGTGPANSNEVTVTATPVTPQSKSASVIVGWSGSTKRLDSNSLSQPFPVTGIAGAQLTTSIYGPTTLVASVCQPLNAELTLISPNGTSHTTAVPQNTDFVNVAPTPNCAFDHRYYAIGSSVYFLADGTSAGYDFVSWSGALTGTEPYPTTPVAFDGHAPVKLGATYQVKCFTLASNFDNVAVEPAPNCPDTPASAHSYIGGTSVTLQAKGDGNLVFRGWKGNPEVAQGAIAVTAMSDDMSIYADYTSRSIGESIAQVANTVGDAIAISSKKLVGVAAAVVGGLLTGANPLTAVMGVAVLLGKAVQGIADLLGVSSDGLVAFTGVISSISEMMTFLSAATQCATVWSAGADGSSSTTGTSTEQAVGTVIAKQVIAEQKAAALAASRALQQQAIAASFQNQSAAMAGTPLASAAGSTVGTAKVWAGRLGAAASVGVGVYSMVSGGSGVQWDSSAAAAWTTGFDTYSTCYGQSLPSFFGLPPVPSQ